MRANDRKDDQLNLDRIEKGKIVLNGSGQFPKDLIINEKGRPLKYRLIKTKNGKYHLNR